MKKTYFKFLNALEILCVSPPFVPNFNGDDKDNGKGSNNTSLIVGKRQMFSHTGFYVSAENLKLSKTTFIAKVKNPITSGRFINSYKQME